MTQDSPSRRALEEARRLAERELPLDEYRAAAAVPIGEDERRDIVSLIRWFCRRYPTPAERLAYARRAYARWTRAAGR